MSLFLQFIFTMNIRSRKRSKKKETFLFDSIIFSKSWTGLVVGVVVCVRMSVSHLRFRMNAACSRQNEMWRLQQK